MDNHLSISPRATSGRGGPIRRSLVVLGFVSAALLFGSPPASAASTVSAEFAATLSDADVIDTLEVDGRIIEPPSNRTVDSAADRANAADIAFAWLDRTDDDGLAVDLADEYVEELGARGSRYQTVLVVVGNGFAASSLTRSQLDLDGGLDAALAGFADGDMGRGLDAFVASMAVSGGTAGDSGTTTSSPSDAGSSDSGGGVGFGSILLVVALVGGGFFLVRRMLRGRRDREQAEIDLAEDRAEIEEQLKNNADRVISLGDRVIAKGDRELIVLYEEASASYQDVSQRIDEAETAAEIDELDDRIDQAEWQFEVIEASLEGRPRPRPPVPDDVIDDAPTGRQDRGRDDGTATPAGSGHGLPPVPQSPSGRQGQPPVATSPRTGRTYPRSTGRRRRGGGLGGVLGGGLGGVLADIVLGGGLGGLGGSSRRTRRRSSTGGGIGSRRSGGGIGGGLGGGVLRRGGGSSRRPPSRRSSGGRSTGGRRRSRSRGGRQF